MNEQNIRFSDISPRCLLRYLLRHLWMIVVAATVFAMAASVYADLFHTSQYRATMTYAVTSRRTSYTSSSNISTAIDTATVLSEMLPSDMVRKSIRGADPELAAFSGSVTAYLVSETNFIVISATDTSAEGAFRALLALEDILPTITGYVSGSCVVQQVRIPTVSAAPINTMNSGSLCVKAGLLGGTAMAALLFWFFLRRDTVQTRAGARRKLDAPIIVSIYREGRIGLKQLFSRNKKMPLQIFAPTTSFGYTEQINTVCARMEQERLSHGSKVFLVAGVSENEGKSTVAANVACALSLMGKQVALLDCDLRNPSLCRFFDGKYAAELPLNRLLAQPLDRDSLAMCIQRHEKLGIYMLFPTNPDRRCAELLSGQTMDALLSQLRGFDYVILDTPPMSYFADAEALAEKADASMLVVRQDLSSADAVNGAAQVLGSAGSRFLGCILNDMTHALTEGNSYGYGYGYGRYGYGQYNRRKGG